MTQTNFPWVWVYLKDKSAIPKTCTEMTTEWKSLKLRIRHWRWGKEHNMWSEYNNALFTTWKQRRHQASIKYQWRQFKIYKEAIIIYFTKLWHVLSIYLKISQNQITSNLKREYKCENYHILVLISHSSKLLGKITNHRIEDITESPLIEHKFYLWKKSQTRKVNLAPWTITEKMMMCGKPLRN